MFGTVLGLYVIKQGSIDVENLDKLAARDAEPDGPDLDPGLLACDNGEDPVKQCDSKGCELVCKAPLLWMCANTFPGP